MMESSTENRRDERIAFAQTLDEFEDQRRWYSNKAGQHKSNAQWIDLIILIAGVIIAALPALRVLEGTIWAGIATTVLGGLIVVSQGVQRIFRYAENWLAYRRASERMKHEWRSFVNGVPPYSFDDEAAARVAYVAALQTAIAEEQKMFFERSADKPPSKSGG